MNLIVTHKAPDLDAIGAVWLLKIFDNQHYADADVAFVQPGKNITPYEIQEQLGTEESDYKEITHVDTGLGKFDHHQPERGNLPICATSLVYTDHILAIHPDKKEDKALKNLVDVITDIDHFGECYWPESTNPRYAFSLHEILSGLQRAGFHNDETQLAFGMKSLNGVYAKLKDHHTAQRKIKEKGKEFATRWGKALAVETRNDTVIKYGQKLGYTIVVRKDSQYGHVRMKALPKSNVDFSPIYKKLKEIDNVGTWYLHPSGKMLLNGSSKWTDKVATPLPLEKIIKILKE